VEKKKSLTVITGFSLKEKCELIKKVKGRKHENVKVILFRPMNIEFLKKADDPFTLTQFISEAVHDIEINTFFNLLETLKKEAQNNNTTEIILDVYPISDIHTFFESLTIGSQKWFLTSHIHVIDSRKFWFSYFSEHEILIYTDSTLATSYTLGETLINQLELADSIVLMNSEQLSHERMGELMMFIRSLQPKALIHLVEEFNWQMNNRKTAFDTKAASSLYTHQIELFSSRNKLKVIGQHGIDTFIYQSFTPIDFTRLESSFSQFPNEIFRMKGRCYNPIAQELYFISQVGSSIQVDTTEIDTSTSLGIITEFLFIGSELDQSAIQTLLDRCLCNPNNYSSLSV
jgi:G3E family GTPase